jgi:hypothetical protein
MEESLPSIKGSENSTTRAYIAFLISPGRSRKETARGFADFDTPPAIGRGEFANFGGIARGTSCRALSAFAIEEAMVFEDIDAAERKADARFSLCRRRLLGRKRLMISVIPKITAPALSLVEPILCAEYREGRSPIGSRSLVNTNSCSCHPT